MQKQQSDYIQQIGSGVASMIGFGVIILAVIFLIDFVSKKAVKDVRDEFRIPSTPTNPYKVENATVQSIEPIGGELYQIRWLSTYEEPRFNQRGTAVTSYKDIKIGDKVSVHVDPTSFSHVTKWTPSDVTSW